MPDDEKYNYYFYDINAKINHKFSDRSRLYLSAYNGKDHFATQYMIIAISRTEVK